MKALLTVAFTTLSLSLATLGCGGIYGPIIVDIGDDDGGGYAGSSGGGRGGVPAPVGGTGGALFPTAPPPLDSRVAYFSFDEGSGTDLIDSSLNANHGKLVEGTMRPSPPIAVPNWVEGKLGQAYGFDGLNDWAVIPSSDSINAVGVTNKGVSLAAWVKFDRYDQISDNGPWPFRFIIQRDKAGSGSVEHFGLGLREGRPFGNISFFFLEAPEVIALNEWTHLAMTYDGVVGTLYINGRPIREEVIAAPISPDTTPIIIGAGENNGLMKEFSSAAVDEVYIYARQLTPFEVVNVMMQKR